MIYKRALLTCKKYVEYKKIYSGVKEVLDFNIPWNFQPKRTCLSNIIWKLKKTDSLACISGSVSLCSLGAEPVKWF